MGCFVRVMLWHVCVWMTVCTAGCKIDQYSSASCDVSVWCEMRSWLLCRMLMGCFVRVMLWRDCVWMTVCTAGGKMNRVNSASSDGVEGCEIRT